MPYCRKQARAESQSAQVSIAVLLAVLTLLAGLDVDAADSAKAGVRGSGSPIKQLQSGPKKGSTIHQFFVRAVTGPHRNRSVCYVCRYGSRPVVMVMIQQPDPKIADLLKAIDEIVDENRVSGLRSFGVLVTDESATAVPVLQTMAFDEQIQMPLTAATTAVAGPSCHNLHPDAATTVMLYRDQQSVRNFAFARGTINEATIAPLIASIAKLIEPDNPE